MSKCISTVSEKRLIVALQVRAESLVHDNHTSTVTNFSHFCMRFQTWLGSVVGLAAVPEDVSPLIRGMFVCLYLKLTDNDSHTEGDRVRDLCVKHPGVSIRIWEGGAAFVVLPTASNSPSPLRPSRPCVAAAAAAAVRCSGAHIASQRR